MKEKKVLPSHACYIAVRKRHFLHCVCIAARQSRPVALELCSAGHEHRTEVLLPERFVSYNYMV